MLQAVAAAAPTKIHDLSRQGVHNTGDLDNMLAAIARRVGNQRQALSDLAEAFAETFAQAAVAQGSPIAWRYALEVALQNAFDRHTATNPPPGPVAA